MIIHDFSVSLGASEHPSAFDTFSAEPHLLSGRPTWQLVGPLTAAPFSIDQHIHPWGVQFFPHGDASTTATYSHFPIETHAKVWSPKKNTIVELIMKKGPPNKNQACPGYPQLKKKQVYYRCHHLQSYYILGVASKCQWSLRMTWNMLRIGDLHLPPSILGGGPHPNHIYAHQLTPK